MLVRLRAPLRRQSLVILQQREGGELVQRADAELSAPLTRARRRTTGRGARSQPTRSAPHATLLSEPAASTRSGASAHSGGPGSPS